MKKKVTWLVNLATICLCVCAIVIGVYAVKTATLNVGGTVGFTANNCDFTVKSTVKCASNSEAGATITTSPEKTSTCKSEGTTAKSFNHDVGTLYFNDVVDNGNIVEISLTIKNDSKFKIAITLNSLPTFTNTDGTGNGNMPSDMTKTVKNGDATIIAGDSVDVEVGKETTFVITLTIPTETLQSVEDMSGKLKLNFGIAKAQNGYDVTMALEYGGHGSAEGLQQGIAFYSVDGGTTWIDCYDGTNTTFTLKKVQKIKFKVVYEEIDSSYGYYATVSGSGIFINSSDGSEQESDEIVLSENTSYTINISYDYL